MQPQLEVKGHCHLKTLSKGRLKEIFVINNLQIIKNVVYHYSTVCLIQFVLHY